MNKPLRFTATLFAAVVAIISFSLPQSCGKSKSNKPTEGGKLPDTLRVVTLYSPRSYFIYRNEPMGYDYNIVSRYAEDKGMALKLEVAPSLNRAIEMLDSGKVDLIAYEVPEITEYKDKLLPCGPRNETYQVIVQPTEGGQKAIADVTDLPGHTVYAEENSKYLYRLQNLNEELGGGIDIQTIDNDTIITDDLFEMVARGKIPMTVVDNDVALINAPYFPNLDTSVEISFHQTSAWAVAPDNKRLADDIDSWIDTDQTRQDNAALYKRYFEESRGNSSDVPGMIGNGVNVSDYDNLFKKYAAESGFDWRLLAAISYQESRFNPNAVSWAGARGLMQIMPRIGSAYGVSPGQLANPETSVKTAVKILTDLDNTLQKTIPDPEERIKFMLACYNGGIGHISDAQRLAKKHGLDPAKWYGNAERGVMMKSDPKYYRTPEVKYGYMRGRETTDYVTKILSHYNRIKAQYPA